MHRLPVGAERVLPPLAAPHAPFTVWLHTVLLSDHAPLPVAEQVAVAEPWYPPTLFVSDCVWLREAVVVVAEQLPQPRLVDGHVLYAVQFAVEPVFAPVQDHVHGPVPDTVVGVPDVQRLVGVLARSAPWCDPHTPLMICRQLVLLVDHEPCVHVAVALPVQPPVVFDKLPLYPWFCADCEPEQLPHVSVDDVQLRFDEQLAVVPPKAPVQLQV